MSTYYPEEEKNKRSRPHYVEFNRGDRPNEFTIFRRQWLFSEMEMKVSDNPIYALNGGEVHPWNIFTSEFGPDGCVPDKAWVCWMVDALNDRWDAEIRGRQLSAEINS